MDRTYGSKQVTLQIGSLGVKIDKKEDILNNLTSFSVLNHLELCSKY